jgi:hypothetical protein
MILQLVLSLFSAAILFYGAKSIFLRMHNARKAEELGAGHALEYQPSDFLGINPIRALLKANEEGKIPAELLKRFESMSKLEGRPVHVMRGQFLRAPFMLTRDPKAIQAILATQFKEFELGAIRLGTFGPL